jgi:LmbE family N-acetylglucosaminyl deacetylase
MDNTTPKLFKRKRGAEGGIVVFNSKTILAVGAHPDDIELGAGGTLYKAVRSNSKVIALYMTRGGKNTDSNTRMKESTQAMNILGVNDVYFENFTDTEIPDSYETIGCLERYAEKFQPDVVLTHSVNDTHQDHRRVAWLAMAAFRNVPKILSFETPRVRPAAFMPTYFVNITGCIDKKGEALKCHVSQRDKRYITYESTVNLSYFRGSQVGAQSAEAFEIIKYLEM